MTRSGVRPRRARLAPRLMVAHAAAVGAMLASVLGPGCGPGFDAEESLVRTGTVSLGSQRLLFIDTPVVLDLQASPRVDEVTWRFDGTVSATSAGAARNLAESIDVDIDDGDRDRVALALPVVQRGLLEGVWTMTAPADLDVEVVGRGPSQVIRGFEGGLAVDAAAGVAVLQHDGDVAIRSNTGEVLIDSTLVGNPNIDVSAGASVQLAIPLRVSAQIEAVAGPGRVVGIQHPALPPWPGGGQPYFVSLGGALSRVRLVSRAGDVFITPPL